MKYLYLKILTSAGLILFVQYAALAQATNGITVASANPISGQVNGQIRSPQLIPPPGAVNNVITVTSGGTGSGKDTLPIGGISTNTSASTKDSVAIQLEKDAIARQQTSDQDQRIQDKIIARSNQVIEDKRVNTQGIGKVTHIEVSSSGITTLGSATK